MQFEETKRRILEKYQIAIDQGLVDEDMIPINSEINDFDQLVTTSTCYGRAIIISKDGIRSKYETNFHFKTHSPEEIADWDLEEISFSGELWFLVEAPNLHIRCKDHDSAKILHQMALQAKLSKSKFQSIDPSLVVEILGTSSMQVPLGKEGKVSINQEGWNLIQSAAEEMLTEEQVRLLTFYHALQKRNTL